MTKISFKNIVLVIALTINGIGFAQTDWNGKKCAVVLTYDDALNEHLDNVVLVLNDYGLKGTFYLIGASPVVANRLEEWRKVAKQGHELGNHTLNHPCDGSQENREWVPAEADLSRYTVARAVNEIKATNALLKAIDGKDKRTFAYPCGDLTINDTLFYKEVKNEFVAARGVASVYAPLKEIDLNDVYAFGESGTTAGHMIAEIEEAEKKGSCIVFIFHGVGGGHPLNIDIEEHRKLLDYLKKHKKDIWVPTMLQLGEYIKEKQGK
ncbi:polysaccharide deacetylase family protein [Flavobacterium beibuense]|uniref:polysaccharide deacetylase family protein n=1 Tax=Flavobacterium beibuense TaxID=657326 RepID=UPI001E626156|nr:polysaccharide deacetylase family protein [Flavobacterium beibuense]